MPDGPGVTAVIATSLVWHSSLGDAPPPERIATGRNTASSVEKSMPAAVRTTVPDGMLYGAVGSQFVHRTAPVAAVRSTRLPVAGNSPSASTGIVMVTAGTTAASWSTLVALGSARTEKVTGPTVSTCGVRVIAAWGRSR